MTARPLSQARCTAVDSQPGTRPAKRVSIVLDDSSDSDVGLGRAVVPDTEAPYLSVNLL